MKKTFPPTLILFEPQTDLLESYKRAFTTELGYHVIGFSQQPQLLKYLDKNAPVDLLFVNLSSIEGATLKFIKTLQSHQQNAQTEIFFGAEIPYPNELIEMVPPGRGIVLPKSMTPINAIKAIKIVTSQNKKNSLKIGRFYNQILQESLEAILRFYLPEKVFNYHHTAKKIEKNNCFISVLSLLEGEEHLGTILINFSKELILQLGQSMVEEDELGSCHEEEILDIAGEICNQLQGILEPKLRAQGIPITIGVPIAFLSEKGSFIHPGQTCAGQLVFSSPKPGKNLSPTFDNDISSLSSIEICLEKFS